VFSIRSAAPVCHSHLRDRHWYTHRQFHVFSTMYSMTTTTSQPSSFLAFVLAYCVHYWHDNNVANPPHAQALSARGFSAGDPTSFIIVFIGLGGFVLLCIGTSLFYRRRALHEAYQVRLGVPPPWVTHTYTLAQQPEQLPPRPRLWDVYVRDEGIIKARENRNNCGGLEEVLVSQIFMPLRLRFNDYYFSHLPCELNRSIRRSAQNKGT
jgi:hypothetical protein